MRGVVGGVRSWLLDDMTERRERTAAGRTDGNMGGCSGSEISFLHWRAVFSAHFMISARRAAPSCDDSGSRRRSRISGVDSF